MYVIKIKHGKEKEYFEQGQTYSTYELKTATQFADEYTANLMIQDAVLQFMRGFRYGFCPEPFTVKIVAITVL